MKVCISCCLVLFLSFRFVCAHKSIFAGLSLEQVHDARAMFKKFDADGNGVIDKEEFFTLIKSITPNVPTLMLHRISELHFRQVGSLVTYLFSLNNEQMVSGSKCSHVILRLFRLIKMAVKALMRKSSLQCIPS